MTDARYPQLRDVSHQFAVSFDYEELTHLWYAKLGGRIARSWTPAMALERLLTMMAMPEVTKECNEGS